MIQAKLQARPGNPFTRPVISLYSGGVAQRWNLINRPNAQNLLKRKKYIPERNCLLFHVFFLQNLFVILFIIKNNVGSIYTLIVKIYLYTVDTVSPSFVTQTYFSEFSYHSDIWNKQVENLEYLFNPLQYMTGYAGSRDYVRNLQSP